MTASDVRNAALAPDTSDETRAVVCGRYLESLADKFVFGVELVLEDGRRRDLLKLKHRIQRGTTADDEDEEMVE